MIMIVMTMGMMMIMTTMTTVVMSVMMITAVVMMRMMIMEGPARGGSDSGRRHIARHEADTAWSGDGLVHHSPQILWQCQCSSQLQCRTSTTMNTR
jgi:hypothetical protein